MNIKRIDDRYGPITFMNLTFEPEYLFIDYPLYVGKTYCGTRRYCSLFDT
jgi:hypothetical protein